MSKAPVVDVWTMREAIVRSRLGNMAEAQSLSPDDLEGLWRSLWDMHSECCSDLAARYLSGGK